MITLIAFWVVIVSLLIIYLLSLKYKKIEKAIPFFLLLAISLIIVAIATKDPLFRSFGIPVEFE